MSTTDEQRTGLASADEWANAVTRALNDQRGRTRRFLQRQQERFVELHRQLVSQLGKSGTSAPAGGQAMESDRAELIERLNAEVEQLRTKLRHAEAAGPDAASKQDALLAEVQALRSERQGLLDRITDAEKQLNSRLETTGVDQQQYEDLRRRFEMAVDEVRELKAKNAESEQRRERGQAAKSPPPAQDPGGNLDWEAQKQRLMAQLEDFDDEDEDEARDRLTIEGAIRITDQVVAEKEQQIEEMRSQLEPSEAVEDRTRVVAELLDADEVITSEREKLRRLQEDWQEKMRKAEIEISVERAKLARERTTMEEQIQSYKAQLARLTGGDSSSAEVDGSQKSKRGNWLSRLGLTGDE
jgi:chromosome segregation ATPase